MALVYFFSILLSSLLILAGLVVFIIGISGYKSKPRNIGLILFGVGFICLIISISLTVRATVNKVKSTFEPFTHFNDSLNAYNAQVEENSDLLNDDRSYLLSDTSTNTTMKLIKEESLKNNPQIADSYFTHFGSNEFVRLPLIYPFAVHSWDGKTYGTLVNEENETDIKYSTGHEENVVFNITHFNFDHNFVLIKASETQTDNANLMFLLYDMKKKTSKDFKSEQELTKAAKKLGYKGSNELVSLWDYDRKF